MSDRDNMSDRDKERLDRQFVRWEQRLPSALGRTIRWLRTPPARWVRIPAGILLVLGGIFSILPVLGIWMLPLGLLLLAVDLPLLRGPVARALIWLERKWVGWRRSRRD